MDFHMRRAVTRFGRLELELLEPVNGPTPHMVFLKNHGPGLYSLGLGEVSDYDHVRHSLRRGGIDVEMAWQRDKDESTTKLLATQPALGALLELEHRTASL